MTSMEYDGPPTIRRWDGRAKETSDWNYLRRDPELFFAGGDCFVYLYAQGTSKYGPSFRCPSELLVHAKCGPLAQLAVTATASGALPHDKHRRRFSSQSFHPIDSTQSRSASYSFLYLNVPKGCSGFESCKYHITTRNFFAWMVGVPLVGIDPLSALIDLKLRMDVWRDNSVDNVKTIVQYMEEQEYADVPELRTQLMHYIQRAAAPTINAGLSSQNNPSAEMRPEVKKTRRKSIGQEVLHGLSSFRGWILRPGRVSDEGKVGLAVNQGVSPYTAFDEPAVPPAHAPQSSFTPLLLDTLSSPQLSSDTISKPIKTTRSRSESLLPVTDSPASMTNKDSPSLSDSVAHPDGLAQSLMLIHATPHSDQKAQIEAVLRLNEENLRHRKALRLVAPLTRSKSKKQHSTSLRKPPSSETLTFRSDIGQSLSSMDQLKALDGPRLASRKRKTYPLDPMTLSTSSPHESGPSPGAQTRPLTRRTSKNRILHKPDTHLGNTLSPYSGPIKASLKHQPSVSIGRQKVVHGDKMVEQSRSFPSVNGNGRGRLTKKKSGSIGATEELLSSNRVHRKNPGTTDGRHINSNDLFKQKHLPLISKNDEKNPINAAATSPVVSCGTDAQTREISAKGDSQAHNTVRTDTSGDFNMPTPLNTWHLGQSSASAVDISTKAKDDICAGCGKRQRPKSFDIGRVRQPHSVTHPEGSDTITQTVMKNNALGASTNQRPDIAPIQYPQKTRVGSHTLEPRSPEDGGKHSRTMTTNQGSATGYIPGPSIYSTPLSSGIWLMSKNETHKISVYPPELGDSQLLPLMSGAIPPQTREKASTPEKEVQLAALRYADNGASTDDLVSPVSASGQGFMPLKHEKAVESMGDDSISSPITPVHPSNDFSSMKSELGIQSPSLHRTSANSKIALELEGSVPDPIRRFSLPTAFDAEVYELPGETMASPTEEKDFDADIFAIDTDTMDLYLSQDGSGPSSAYSTLNMAGTGASMGLARGAGLDSPAYKAFDYRVAVA